jgi:dephospho-CoA kinase
MNRRYCVALTGGVGSGKSRVADLFAGLGAEVVDTDVIARELTAADGDAMAAIRAAFGPDYVLAEGGLDRARMRAKVFAEPAARQRLEAILHPRIRARAAEMLSASSGPYVLLVVPLLVETDAYANLLDRVLVVDCLPVQQIERVVRRDGVPEAMARAMVAAQVDRSRRLAVADDVIDNSGARSALDAQVARLHQAYLKAAGDAT